MTKNIQYEMQGTPCDLVTGEEKRFGNEDESTANHAAITIEMAPVDRKCKLVQFGLFFKIKIFY